MTRTEYDRFQLKDSRIAIFDKLKEQDLPKLVGGATIEPRPGKASHVAYFGIYLKRQFRSMGIGTQC